MHRQPLLQLIDTYAEKYPEEQEMTSRLRDFVRDYPDCFERSQQVGHITGSCWLVDTSWECVLLTHHRKLDIWVQLGGHADGVTDALEASMIEAKEESGLAQIRVVDSELFDVDIHEIPARKAEPAHYHYDCRFLLQAVSSDEVTISDESHDLKWVPISELEDYTTETSIMRMRDKYLRFRAENQL